MPKKSQINEYSDRYIMLKSMHFEIDFITWGRRTLLMMMMLLLYNEMWHDLNWSEIIVSLSYVIRYQKLTATRIQWNLRQGRTRCAPWPSKPTPGAAPVPSYLMALSCKLGATSTVLSKFVTSSLVLQVWSLTTSMKISCHCFLLFYYFSACPHVIWGPWESHIGHDLLPFLFLQFTWELTFSVPSSMPAHVEGQILTKVFVVNGACNWVIFSLNYWSEGCHTSGQPHVTPSFLGQLFHMIEKWALWFQHQNS